MPHKKTYHLSDSYFIQQMIPEANKKATISFFKIYLLQIIAFILSIYIGFYLYHQGKVKVMLAEEVEHVQLAPLILTKNFGSIAIDLFLLQDDDFLHSYIESLDETSLNKLKDRFHFFSKSRTIYQQVRFIDNNGMEVVRINNNGEPKAAPDEELQDKSTHYYFTQTNKLGRNEIFISPLDLNIEHGKPVYPLQPTIRFGIPVFSKTGENRGIVLFNYNIKPLLAEFAQHFVSTQAKQYSIVRYDGQYLSSPDEKKRLSTEFLFSKEHPEIWEMISKSDNFQTKLENSVFTALAFKPVKKMQGHLSESLDNIEVSSFDSKLADRKITIVSQISNNLEFSFLSYQSGGLFLLYLLCQLSIAGFIWIKVRHFLLKKEFGLRMEFFFQGIERNPASIILTDHDGNILYTNAKFSQLSGYSQDDIYLQTPRILKSGEMSDTDYNDIWKEISSVDTWSGEFHNKRKDDSFYWVFVSISPIFDKNEQIVGFLGIQEDISLRKQLQEKLEKQASTDSLTGLENRRSLFSKMEVEIERSKRGGHALSLLIIDIDYFKKVNDVYGHQTGDEVLKDLSSILKKSIRSADICARFGGEEFVIAMPETTKENCAVFAERLRQEIEEHHVAVDGGSLQYTLSIGVTEWNQEEDLEETIARADTLLYQAKDGGRNMVVTS